ncbi:MAG: GNAT family N-acetyltransferase [Patescibacteria group bacterium]
MIRGYTDVDYDQVKALYEQTQLFGGQFDENRDSRDRLRVQSTADAESILVSEVDNKIVGTISLIVDQRVAWLFRFAVVQGEHEAEVTKELYDRAVTTLKARGHNQVLVYSPVEDPPLDARYATLGFSKGTDFTCFWRDI